MNFLQLKKETKSLIPPKSKHHKIQRTINICNKISELILVFRNFIEFRKVNKKNQKKIVKDETEDGGKYCKMCKIQFGWKSSKKLHDDTYHGDFVTRYWCNICDLTSFNVKNIITHYMKKHPDVPVSTKWKRNWLRADCKYKEMYVIATIRFFFH